MPAIPPTNGFWADQFLRQLNAPVTRQHKAAVLAWMRAENTKAKWNPLATTHGWSNATSFNTAGVKNYLTFADGMGATIQTILYWSAGSSRYGSLLTLLRQPKSTAAAITKAVEASPWGTHNLDAAWALIVENYSAANARLMGKVY